MLLTDGAGAPGAVYATVPDALYEDQEKEESSLSNEEEFFNFGTSDDVLDLPEL